MQRGHLENSFSTGEFEHTHLEHHRDRLDDEQCADDDQQQFGTADDSHTRNSATESQGPGVTKEDLGRLRIPPQETETGSCDGNGHHGDVVRITHRVAMVAGSSRTRTPLVELPDAQQGVGAEDHGGGPRRQPVQAVGEVHRIGTTSNEQDHPDDAQPDRQMKPGDVAQE